MQRIIREEEPTKPSTKLSTLGDALTSVAERRRTSAELLRKMVKGDLDWIVMKALEKDRRRRYETAHSLAEDVERHLASQPVLACSPGAAYRLGKFYRRNRVKLAVAAVISALVVVVLASVAGYLHNRKARWARRKALPMVAKLLERGDYLAAFFVAEEAEKYIPEDPILVELWPEISRPYSIWSDPEGADVYYKEYADIEGEWLYLGRTPLESIRFPRGVYRWKLVKEGFETRECGIGGIRDIITVKLQLKNNYPEMVCVTDRRFDEYLMDKYEVTNERYKKFVDAGGYYKSEYWKHPFLKDGEQISWEEAMGEFRDKTSRPGPSNWEGGTYPQNRAKFPVSGISWYEAAAYAEFAGKSLPAVAHWFAAARVYSEATVVVPYSNFGQRPAPVGIHRGVGLQGLHDMAGNVREWCFNATDDSGTQRYILGGAYADPDYMFGLRDITTPWDRSDKNGFRCAKYLATKDSLASSLLEPIERKLRRDISKPKPYSDEEFRSDKRLYSYDRTDLAARKELTDSSPEHWRIERVTFDAAYGNERVIAYLFLPKNRRPPYQPIVYFPGADTGGLPSSEIPGDVMVFDHILMSGRAVIYPVYKGTYDRRHEKSLPALPAVPVAHRNRTVQIYQDLARTIDYLEIRGDMNVEKLTYFGFSRGVVKGPLLVALEDRIRAAILEAGGCNAWDEPIPSADPLRFATRVKVPILMLNGLNDAIFPQDNQKVLFESLGTPDEHKDHLTYATGHVISGESREKMRRDILEWLDKYLGPPDKIDGKPRSGGGE